MNSQSSAAFSNVVDVWVESAIRGGAVGFGQLLRSLPGVYPSVARDSLHRLVERGALAARIVERMLSEPLSEFPHSPETPHVAVLPVPHPLDYE
jgi:hypothetical protein